MAEHLYAHQLALGAAHLLLLDLAVDLCHLVHVELACQHHDIGKLCIKLQGLYVADVELCGEMHLHAHLSAVGHHRHVAGNDRRHLGLMGGIDDLSHGLKVFAVDYGVDGEIALHAVLVAGGGNLLEVVDGEMVCRVGAHVELPNAEIDRVGTGLYRCGQALAGAYRGHYFKFLLLHCSLLLCQIELMNRQMAFMNGHLLRLYTPTSITYCPTFLGRLMLPPRSLDVIFFGLST